MITGNRNPICNTFGERLKFLMESDENGSIDTTQKGAPMILCRRLYDKKILEYSSDDYVTQGKNRDNSRKTIYEHMKLDSAENINGKWLKAYCDYFHCSADYLFGYIDMPTHQETDIEKVTGLSRGAINSLEYLKKLCELFPSSENDKIDIINLILLDKHKKTSLSSTLDLITGFCRFNISSDRNKLYTVDQRGITSFQHHKIPSEKGISYNPLQAHFHLDDMESMYYLKIWDSIKELKEMYNESKAPDTK